MFPVFCYFTRAGSVLSALDGFDEAVPETTQEGLLALFTEVAQVLSAESAVVMTSRVSFLEDSPPARRLLDGTSLMPEKLAQQLYAQGVDPRACRSSPCCACAMTRPEVRCSPSSSSTRPPPRRQVTRRWQARPGPVTCRACCGSTSPR